MVEYIIETQNLTKKFGKEYAVKNINMKVEKAKIYGLLGRNGAGKTTTMCMLLNLTTPTIGKINLFGQDLNENKKTVYTKIGSIIETPGFYENLTAKENLKIFSKIRGDYNPKQIEEVLKIVNLNKEENKTFKKYSLGMKQKLGIAAAIIHRPQLLILDEPINGLDPVSIKEIRILLKKLVKDYQITILISSHILSEIENLADVIGIMNKGELIQEITKEELHKKLERKVEIEVDNLNLAKKVLENQKLKENKDYIITNNSIQLLSNLDSISLINQKLVENKIQINKLNLKEENLEEYFTQLIEEV